MRQGLDLNHGPLVLKATALPTEQCDQKKSPNVYKKLPKNDFMRKMIDFNTLQKLPKNVGDLGKFIVAKGFKKLPKVQ